MNYEFGLFSDCYPYPFFLLHGQYFLPRLPKGRQKEEKVTEESRHADKQTERERETKIYEKGAMLQHHIYKSRICTK